MPLSATEQYMLELINRARLDPTAEAARQGIALNAGLAAGTISGAPVQALAPNDILRSAAETHSKWMLDTDTFSHTGAGGSTPGNRMSAAGYTFTGAWAWRENLSWTGTTATLDLTEAITKQFNSLYASASHRVNTFAASVREIGIAQVTGKFLCNGVDYNASMVTQNFAATGTNSFVTGVTYADTVNDNFYTVGEGIGAIRFAAAGRQATSAAAGGYSVAFAPTSALDVTVSQGSATLGVVTVAGAQGNVKLDLVREGSDWTVEVAATATLKSGFTEAKLLGSGNFSLTGNSANNLLTGNGGDNRLYGGAGNDRLVGGSGADSLDGGTGADTLVGGLGWDRYVIDNPGDVIEGEIGYSQGGGIDTVEAWIDFTMKPNLEILRLQGRADLKGFGTWAPESMVGNTGHNLLDGSLGNDTLNGKAGNDTLIGGLGADLLMGEAGADVFVFRSTADSPASATERDFINGFVHGEDKVDLSAIDANPGVSGDQAFSFIGAAKFSGRGADSAGELRYSYWGLAGLLVEADTDGNGTADMQIYVNLTTYMLGSDFVL